MIVLSSLSNAPSEPPVDGESSGPRDQEPLGQGDPVVNDPTTQPRPRSHTRLRAAVSLGAGLLLVAALGACGTRSAGAGGTEASPTLTAIAIPGPYATDPPTVHVAPLPSGSLDGTVTDAAGRPAPGLPVHAVSTTDPSQVMPAPFVTTDARGHYTWAGLPPGPYAVTVASGATRATAQVTVSEGSASRLDLVLR